MIELREQAAAGVRPGDRCAPSRRWTSAGWTSVDAADGVFITAEGLLMYLQPDEAMGLITECAKRFPGGQMMFDLPPVVVRRAGPRRGMRTSLRYRVPPMPFSLSPSEAANLVEHRAGRPRGPRRADARRAAAGCSTR